MLIFWRGLGWAVLPIMFGWVFVMVGVAIATSGSEADPNAAVTVDRLFALAFALSALSVFLLAQRRDRKTGREVAERGEKPTFTHWDHFMFVPMKYWSYLFAAVAAFLIGRSFVG